MSAEVFIRRNGIVQGTFDREEFFASRLQGGILDSDEWMLSVGIPGLVSA
jgi:hypothetical protein